MKKILKALIVLVLAWQVRRLQKRSDFKIVAVVGSYGKTSTKAAIAQTLGTAYKVQWQEGNYNDLVSVPLVFFGIKMPKLFSPKAWLRVFWKIEQQLKEPYPYDIVVLELGTDGPGQLVHFARYLAIDVAVLTAIGPEHMEFFKNVEDVAKEELSVGRFSEQFLANANLVDKMFIDLSPVTVLPYRVRFPKGAAVSPWALEFQGDTIKLSSQTMSEAQVYSLSSAYLVGKLLGMSASQLDAALGQVGAVSGRMNLLRGKNDSQIIDDTYNSSPEATRLALETLYKYPATQRIALLGNMNELGDKSPQYHTEAGALCDPKYVDLVVTLGVDANEYLATAAEANGCKVIRATNAEEAGKVIEPKLRKGTVVLAKGSQNGVFAEEAVKLLLANSHDAQKLVRQNSAWLRKKNKL